MLPSYAETVFLTQFVETWNYTNVSVKKKVSITTTRLLLVFFSENVSIRWSKTD